jgi:DNA-binding NarL/FixJ family response regulator
MVSAAHEMVLVVDDDAGFRAHMRLLLERAGFEVVEAADANETLQAVEERDPDLVLLDVCLPRVSGYELYRLLRDRIGESLPILFISGDRVDAYDRVAGLMLGADDYVVKPFEPDELLARVRRSVRQRAGRDTPPPSQPDATEHLTPRETEVLRLLAEGGSTATIAQQLFISPRTVGTHVQHILAKLGVENRTQAAAYAFRNGLVRPDVEAHFMDGSSDTILVGS